MTYLDPAPLLAQQDFSVFSLEEEAAALSLDALPTDPPQIPLRPRAVRAKRIFDIVAGTIFSLLALPAVIIFAVALGLSLRAWPFFLQRRPGHEGKDFTILKLRTLPTSVPPCANKHDLGLDSMPLPLAARLLRRSHLDELPQLFLVPFGRMSIVGPRPRLPDGVENVDPLIDALRSSIRPGCTGVWQISSESGGVASGSPRLDSFYLQHGGLRLDLWILGRTLLYVTGLVDGITLEDIPQWARGSGLIAPVSDLLPPPAEAAAEPVTLPVAPSVPLPTFAADDEQAVVD